MTELQLRVDELTWREIEGEIVALDTRTSTYMAVNGTGAVLWQALVEGATRDELVAQLEREYDVEPGAAEADVDRFVHELEAAGLLQP